MDSLFSFLTHKKSEPIPGANITFTGHRIFDTDVPTIHLGQCLTPENVINSLRNCTKCNLQKSDISMIQRSFDADKDLSNENMIGQLSGVFIHDKMQGRVLVTGTGTSDRIVSIEV